MSSASRDPFTVESLSIDPIESGTSVLLTGDDSKALHSVFYRLIAADEDERSVVVATDESGQSIRRALARNGAGSRSSVLAATGTGSGDGFETITNFDDLTKVGMSLSSLLADSQQRTPRFRCGILLCSTICGEAEDIRSVYRLLNANFLSELRRGDGIGVCALDTSADIGANTHSIVTGLNTCFNAHIEVEKSGRREATLDISGLADTDTRVTVSL